MKCSYEKWNGDYDTKYRSLKRFWSRRFSFDKGHKVVHKNTVEFKLTWSIFFSWPREPGHMGVPPHPPLQPAYPPHPPLLTLYEYQGMGYTPPYSSSSPSPAHSVWLSRYRIHSTLLILLTLPFSLCMSIKVKNTKTTPPYSSWSLSY